MQPLGSTEVIIYNPKCQKPGSTYLELCNSWCRWILSFPRSTNPTLQQDIDITQQNHDIPNVIFLCQTFDFQNVAFTPQRIVAIPEGAKIFMPIINWIFGLEIENKNDLIKIENMAREKMDEAKNLRFLVNDKMINLNLSEFRFRTVSPDVVLPINNILGMKPGKVIVVADGFWILFKPLARSLRLQTHGTCQSGTTQISVSYYLV